MQSAPVVNHSELPEEAVARPATPSLGRMRRAGAFLLKEFREILPPTIFFFIGFNLIVLTTNLILANYGASSPAS